MPNYYVVKTGPNRFDLRQTRYKQFYQTGKEHPHDLMAVGFDYNGMKEIINKWFQDTDTSELKG
jgi:hypothetical protein